MLSLFRDGPEYIQRTKTPFSPTKVTLAEVRAVVPKVLYQKHTLTGLAYVARDVLCAFALYNFGWFIDPLARSLVEDYGWSLLFGVASKWSIWVLYWYWQGIILAGWWCLAHEAGHGTLSQYNWVNHIVGYSLHTFLLVPYYAWRSTHHAHHKATMSVERDENYVPRTRRYYSLPLEFTATPGDYREIFEETPIYTLFRMLLMQAVGWQYYLCSNVMGSPMYPPGTNVSWIYREFTWRSNHSISTFNLPRLFSNPTSEMGLSPPISVSLSCRSSSIFGLKKLAS